MFKNYLLACNRNSCKISTGYGILREFRQNSNKFLTEFWVVTQLPKTEHLRTYLTTFEKRAFYEFHTTDFNFFYFLICFVSFLNILDRWPNQMWIKIIIGKFKFHYNLFVNGHYFRLPNRCWIRWAKMMTTLSATTWSTKIFQ